MQRKANDVVGLNVDDKDARMRALSIWGLCDCMWVFDHGGLLLTEGEVIRAQKSGRAFLMSWGYLAARAQEEGRCDYHLRPKMHYIDHILSSLPTTRENPQRFSNWMDEDFMGRIVCIARRQHRRVVLANTLNSCIMMLRRCWRVRNNI